VFSHLYERAVLNRFNGRIVGSRQNPTVQRARRNLKCAQFAAFLYTNAACFPQLNPERPTTSMASDGTFRLEFSAPWGERFRFEVPRPKSNLSIDAGPHHRLEQRCAYYRCNRPYPIAERSNKIYCSDDCQEAAKKYRAKLRAAGVRT
jgi:hypothetical protein